MKKVVKLKIYNKLVRDNIPEIMIKNGATPITKILSEDEYLIELNKKLLEEVKEYLESKEIEELADIEEVILAIIEAKSLTRDKLEEIRIKKVRKRGAFKKKIYLEKEL